MAEPPTIHYYSIHTCTTYCTSLVMWIVKMDNFTAIRKRYSIPFHTSLTGYNLCLLVWFNSSEHYKHSQYISVFTVLMCGLNDSISLFPYKGTIIVVLLNQLGDRYHHRCEVESVGGGGVLVAGRHRICIHQKT